MTFPEFLKYLHAPIAMNHFIDQNQGILAILGLWIAAAALLTLNHYINRWKDDRKP